MDAPLENSGAEGAKKSPFDDMSREDLIKKCKGLLVIAQKAKQSKLELQTELETYKLQSNKSDSEKAASQENIKILQELVDSLTEQKLNYITELDTAQNKIKALTVKISNFEEVINKNKLELSQKDATLNEISQKLSNGDSEIISLKRQNNRLVEENEQLLQQLTEMERKTEEVNTIGLLQQKQLQTLEQKVTEGMIQKYEHDSKLIAENLNKKIRELEEQIKNKDQIQAEYETKVKEVTQLLESEKEKKEKANVRLKSYRDKIAKCAACISQLKNARFILTKTVKEYAENIPKWQNEIIKASQFLDKQINELSFENNALRAKLLDLEKRILEFTSTPKDENSTDMEKKMLSLENDLETSKQINKKLRCDLDSLKPKYEHLTDIELPTLALNNNELKQHVDELTLQFKAMCESNNDLQSLLKEYQTKNNTLNDKVESLNNKIQDSYNNESVNLQIKSLENEKSILVKEKMVARDNVIELENQNRILSETVNKLNTDLSSLNERINELTKEKELKEWDLSYESETKINKLKCENIQLLERYDSLKKEYDNLEDLNGLLKDEVETLKMSLEHPNDDGDNLSDLNVSLQADIVKLETKLSAYKQENASLLIEVKESRSKLKEIHALETDYEDTKSKLMSYKTENSELLNEMKEINQALKERGEAISKMEKAIAEMERLIETLEDERNDYKQDKQDMLNKISSLEIEMRNAEKKDSEFFETNEQIKTERDNLNKLLIEKESQIVLLKEEMDKLKQTPPVELPSEDMSTSTISRAEEHARMRDLDESFEDKYSKLRIFALKLKKKLSETTLQLQNVEKEKAKLETMLNENQFSQNTAETQHSDTDQVDGSMPKYDVSQITDLEAKIKTLTDTIEASKNITAELDNAKAELAATNEKLKLEVESHKSTREQLERSRREVKKKSVLSLEMDDYERSMKELTQKMDDKTKKIIQMESTIDNQSGTISAMKTQIKLLEEQIKTEETQTRLIKEELHNEIAEGKEKSNVIQVKNDIISQLERDMEIEKRKNEDTNIEMTVLLGEKEKVIISLGEEKIELNNRLKKSEFKCADLDEKLRMTVMDLEDLKSEYTSYKVRAQAVLRQNQTVDHSQEEQLKEENAALKAQIDALTSKLNIATAECVELSTACSVERARAAEAAAAAARAAQRTHRLQGDLAALDAAAREQRDKQTLQVTTLTQCFKSQIAELEARLQTETDQLKMELKAAQEHAKTAVNVDKLNSNESPYALHAAARDEPGDSDLDINVTMLPREEGEGSESQPRGRSPVPLERLLEDGVRDDDTRIDSHDVTKKLHDQQQRVKHVTQLLSESERECARYAQMNELLKAEVRRARGSLERTQHAHNAEYMKNVTLKFLTLPPGDERGRLVPVLQKILTLTSDETHKLNAVAKGQDPNASKGWGSYLPWPGGK